MSTAHMSQTPPSPAERTDLIGLADVERSLRRAADGAALHHGWLIAGPPGVGKATLAYRAARCLLAPAAALDGETLAVDPAAQVVRLVAQNAHPDLFVAEREINEKTGKRRAEISVDAIRRLIAFLYQTPAMGAARVAIIDKADELNRNAANALLKALEEPPSGAALFLVCDAPGRLPATIRSRCRKIDVPRASDAEIRAYLEKVGVAAADAGPIAEHAEGRPGAAILLAAGAGSEGVKLAGRYLQRAIAGKDVGAVAAVLAGKQSDDIWPVFAAALPRILRAAAVTGARGAPGEGAIDRAPPEALAAAWSRVNEFIGRGEALNLDRVQLLNALAADLRALLRPAM